MSEEVWRPVIATGRENALSEAFPTYLREALFNWIKSQLAVSSYGFLQSDTFVAYQNISQTDLGFKAQVRLSWDQVMVRMRGLTHTEFTNLLDYFASKSSHSTWQYPHPLEPILSNGGSAWTVMRWNGTHARLTKRVPDGVKEAVTTALSAKDAASAKLQEAWLDAYGTNPRASAAYSNAVIAVETAVLSVIPVSKADPTLADVFSILEAATSKWKLIFRDSDRAPGATTLVLMLRTLWRGHASRHGRPDYEDASLEEARAAVILAATLVQWFTSGVVVAARGREHPTEGRAATQT